MKVNSKKRGFTIVELVIVVAVIGILAAILIPTFVNLTSKAKEQSDNLFIRDLNVQLAINEIEEGKNKTMTDAVADAREFGHDVTKLTPYDGKDIVWDSVSDRFALSDKNGNIVYPKDGTIKGTGADIWAIYKEAPATAAQKYSVYAKKGYTHPIDHVYKVGFDAGDIEEALNTFSIDNSTYTGDLIVYTKNIQQEFKINAPQARTVIHYGIGKKLDDAKMNSESYHEYGSLRQAFLDKGHAVVEAGGFIGSLHMTTEDGAAEVTLNSGSTVGSLYIDNSARENKATVKSYGNAKIVYLNVAQSSSQLDIHLDTAPDYANVSDKNEGTAVIVGVGTVSDLDHAAECTGHHWVPQGGKVQVCSVCGEIKFSAPDPNNADKVVDYTEEDNGSGEMSVPAKYEERNVSYYFYNSYTENNHWVHEVSDPNHFRNILTHIAQNGSSSAKDLPLADKDTEYKIVNNIDFGGKLWNESYLQENSLPIFTGKLVADTQVVLSNIYNTSVTTKKISTVEDNEKKMICLFGGAVNATFKNITLDNMVLYNSLGKGASLFAVGYYAKDAKWLDAGYIRFENCITNSNCSVTGESSLAGFVAQGRCYSEMSFVNCVNNANITGSAHADAGFVAAASVGCGTASGHYEADDIINFDNCRNNGTIIGSFRTAGFVSYLSDQRVAKFKNTNINSGKIYCTTNNDNRTGLFVGDYTSSGYIELATGAILQNLATNNLLNTRTEDTGINVKEYTEIKNNLQDINGDPITDSTYNGLFVDNPIVQLNPSFNSNGEVVLGNSISSSTHQINVIVKVGTVLSTFGGKDYPYKATGTVDQSTAFYLCTYENASDFLSTVRRIKYAGYFVPAGAEVYNDTLGLESSTSHLLNDSLKANNYQDGKYSEGVHFGENSYVVVTNENNNGACYHVVSGWRLRISYSFTCLDTDGNIVGLGSIDYDGYVDDDHPNDTTIGAIPNNI